MNTYHTPVLAREAIDFLAVEPGKKYIDATIGGGGHTFEILKRGGQVLGIDVDQEAIEFVEKFHSPAGGSNFQIGKELILARGNFRDIDTIAHSHGFEKVSGILLDLGISSHQINTAERGFSLQKGGPLDMRMDKNLQITAVDLINGLHKGELYELFYTVGQEHNARTISESIVRARRVRSIKTTEDLLSVLEQALGKSLDSQKTRAVVATRVFQALRIAVNSELQNLQEALPKAMMLLERKGRLIVISFHSVEDRIVKNQFLKFDKQKTGTILTNKPVNPSKEEIFANRRSRSAKLRVIEKR